MKRLVRLLYWKLAFPKSVAIFPQPRIRIAGGPFQGMHYIHNAQGSALSAKILGTYEKEIHQWIESVANTPFDRIINIGAGEGYYAIGLARRAHPKQTHIAFESDERGQKLIRQLAERNGISNLTVYGHCGVEQLKSLFNVSAKTLVVCDVEGFESEILDPVRVTGLTTASILVELHEFVQAGISQSILRRFQGTHLIRKTESAPRSWNDFPAQNSLAALLPRAMAIRAMNEGRPDVMSWLYMEPLARSNSL